MGWFKRVLGLEQYSDFEDDFDNPVDPADQDEVTVLARVRFADGTENERKSRIPRNQIPVLAQELMNDLDVIEAWVYEEVSYHHKIPVDEPATTSIALGAALGASAVIGMGGIR